MTKKQVQDAFLLLVIIANCSIICIVLTKQAVAQIACNPSGGSGADINFYNNSSGKFATFSNTAGLVCFDTGASVGCCFLIVRFDYKQVGSGYYPCQHADVILA